MSAGPLLTPLPCIEGPSGAVLHGLKQSAPGFVGFGEAYFSEILGGSIKSWRQHTRVTVNLVVPMGDVQVVVRQEAGGRHQFLDFRLGRTAEIYARLTIPPGLWFAFKGLGPGTNLILSIIDAEHDPAEANTREIHAFPYEW